MTHEDRPNFTGTWILNSEKSKLQLPPPTATTFRIDHDEPRFRLSRTHVYAEQSDTWSIELIAASITSATVTLTAERASTGTTPHWCST